MGAHDGTGATAYRSRHLITGNWFLDMLVVFAEFGTNLLREHQPEDITRAKAAGIYQGGGLR